MMGIGAANRMTYWCLVLLLAHRISRREDALVIGASFANETEALALRLWDKPDNLTHIPLLLNYAHHLNLTRWVLGGGC